MAQEVEARLPQLARGRVQVTDAEAAVDSGGQTYRVLQALRAQHPGRAFAFAMGSDCLAVAPSWSHWDALQESVRIVVLARPGHAAHHPDLLAAPMLPLSSTAVREALGARRPVGHLVPPAVARLLQATNPYAPASERSREGEPDAKGAVMGRYGAGMADTLVATGSVPVGEAQEAGVHHAGRAALDPPADEARRGDAAPAPGTRPPAWPGS